MMQQCKKIFYRVVVMLMLMSVSHGSYAIVYFRINYDPVVTPMLTTSFLANKVLENQNLSKLREVREAYEGASLALAGLQEARRMERKWQRDALSLVNAENYYYQNIYDMVNNRIIPRLYRVAVLCVTVYPGQAEYWLPTLFFICSDVQELCTEFSNIVTNGKLRFTGITFPQIAQELLDGFGITKLKGVDVEELIDEIANFDVDLPDITMDDLNSDIGDIVDFVSSMAQDTWDDVGNMWDDRTRIQDGYENAGGGKAKGIKVIKKKIKQVMGAVDSLKALYAEHQETFDYKGKLQQVLGVLDSTSVMQKLFTYNGLPAEDLENPINSTTDTERYYRQKWCIVKEGLGDYDNGTVICDYKPDKEDVYKWVWEDDINEGDPTHNPLEISKVYCGFNFSKVGGGATMSTVGNYYEETFTVDDIKYDITYQKQRIYRHSSFLFDRADVCYNIKVVQYQRTRIYEEVYCEWFDSKVTTPEIFNTHMQIKLDEYRTGNPDIVKGERVRDEESDTKGFTYKIVQGNRSYYSVPEADHLDGVNSVDFIAKCDDGGKLGELSTERKINEYHDPLCERSKEIMMEDGDAVDDLNARLEEFHALKNSKNDSITMLTRELRSLRLELQAAQELYQHSISGRTKEAREHIANLQRRIDALEDKIVRLRGEVSQIESAEQQCVQDYGGDEDGENIPDHMLYYQTQFPSLEWIDEGHWEGYNYIRMAKIRDFGGEIKFEAKLSEVRDESYWLGIRYHRSIIGVKSSLTYESHTEETVAFMEFPKSISAQDKARQVEQRRQELQADFEDCTITVKENFGEDIETDEGEVVHLLWPSDRLRIARSVFSRLNKIESRLVLLEMFLHHTQQARLSWSSIFNADRWDVTSVRTSSYFNNILSRWRMSAREAAKGNLRREED